MMPQNEPLLMWDWNFPTRYAEAWRSAWMEEAGPRAREQRDSDMDAASQRFAESLEETQRERTRHIVEHIEAHSSVPPEAVSGTAYEAAMDEFNQILQSSAEAIRQHAVEQAVAVDDLVGSISRERTEMLHNTTELMSGTFMEEEAPITRFAQVYPQRQTYQYEEENMPFYSTGESIAGHPQGIHNANDGYYATTTPHVTRHIVYLPFVQIVERAPTQDGMMNLIVLELKSCDPLTRHAETISHASWHGNWGEHYGTAKYLGGAWADLASTRRSINEAAKRIAVDTLGTANDLTLVLGPNDYIRFLGAIEGDHLVWTCRPDVQMVKEFYGFRVHVESAVDEHGRYIMDGWAMVTAAAASGGVGTLNVYRNPYGSHCANYIEWRSGYLILDLWGEKYGR